MRSWVILASLPIVASASASPRKCQVYTTNQIAKYDDLTSAGAIPPHYYGLSYFNFQLDSENEELFKAASGTQYAIAFGGSGSISVPDSPPNTIFDLHSFYFACDAGVPQPPCAVTVTGSKTYGKTVQKVITFPPITSGHFPSEFVLNQTHLGERFSDLKSVSFSIANANDGSDFFGGLILDNLKYTIKEKVC